MLFFPIYWHTILPLCTHLHLCQYYKSMQPVTLMKREPWRVEKQIIYTVKLGDDRKKWVGFGWTDQVLGLWFAHFTWIQNQTFDDQHQDLGFLNATQNRHRSFKLKLKTTTKHLTLIVLVLEYHLLLCYKMHLNIFFHLIRILYRYF